jgi:AcrR family transcriptional regulator
MGGMEKAARTPNDERTRRRRERILDAAFHVFSRTGYRDAAVDDIAREAETSKGGIYFHFPTKESILMELMGSTADRLVGKVVRAVEARPASDPVGRAGAAIDAVLAIFAGHRSMARLLLVDGLGAGSLFRQETLRLHDRFVSLIASYLDGAVDEGAIPPVDTRIAATAWFGALHELVVGWLVAEQPTRLEEHGRVLRALLLRSVGVSEERIRLLETDEP